MYSCDKPLTARFCLQSPRHFVNLNITHGWLQFLMCHNSLKSLLLGCSLSYRNETWVICEGGKPERQNIHFHLWDSKCSDTIIFSFSLRLYKCHTMQHVREDIVTLLRKPWLYTVLIQYKYFWLSNITNPMQTLVSTRSCLVLVWWVVV